MTGRKIPALDQKHWDALRLLNEGDKTIKQVAAEIGWSADYLYALVEGNTRKTGRTGDLFSSELRKVDANLSKKIKTLLKSNKLLAAHLINDILLDFKEIGSLDEKRIALLTQINNSLIKATPNVEIGNLSYNYTKGLTGEELVHEFNRLRTIADTKIISVKRKIATEEKPATERKPPVKRTAAKRKKPATERKPPVKRTAAKRKKPATERKND